MFSFREKSCGRPVHQSPVGLRFVDIVQDSCVVDVHESNFMGMAVDYNSRLRIGRKREKLRNQIPGKKHRMPAAALESRNGKGGIRLFEQPRERGLRHIGMIHKGEQNTLRLGIESAQTALHRGQLPGLVAGILNKQYALGMPHAVANPLGFSSYYHNYRIANLRKTRCEAIQKSFSLKLEQGLWRSHPARFPRRQNQAGNAHFSSACVDSAAKIDMDSERQLELGLRRTAIISAATETAISSGEIAPISRPMGA